MKIKRIFDLVVSILALILFLLLLGVVAFIVRWRLGSPALFKQQRPGLRGKPFIIYKFRTMIDEKGVSGNLLPDAQRLTKFGQFLRKSSLDELPALVNVLFFIGALIF